MNRRRLSRHSPPATRHPRSRDRLTRERRSWNMSRIRGKHTAPELIVRSLLHRLGYRFRLHKKIPIFQQKVTKTTKTGTHQLTTQNSSTPQPGRRSRTLDLGPWTLDSGPRFVRPDIVLPKHRVAIFVHGCFWHRHRGCKNCTTPTHRREWWLKKLEGNAARDKIHQRALRKLGWRVIVIWECETERIPRLNKLQDVLAQCVQLP